MIPHNDESGERLVLLAACIVKLGVLLVFGVHVAPDTAVYVGMADELLGRKALGTSFPEASYWPLYLGYPIFLTPFRVAFGAAPGFASAVAASQALLGAVAARAFFRTALLLTRSNGWAVVAAVCLAVNPEALNWDRTLLADSLNLSLLVVAMHTVVVGLINGPNRHRLFASGAVLLFVRPTNLVFLTISTMAIVSRRGRLFRVGLAVAFALLALLLAVSTRRFDTSLGRSFVAQSEAGVVINHRPQYDVVAPTGPRSPALRVMTVGRVAAKRALLFWAPVLDGFSLRHTVLNLLFFVPLWTLAGMRASAWLRGSGDVVDATLVALAVGYTLFHAFTMIDFDLRYRLPVFPPVHLLAARTLARFAERPQAPALHVPLEM